MRTLLPILCGVALTATSCNAFLPINNPTDVPGLVGTIVVQTAQAASSATAAAAPPPSATAIPVAACLDGAAIIQDTTGITSTSVPLGSRFTKTWQLKNTGTCTWHGYSLAFASGDRMAAPESIAIGDTPPESTVTAAMDLVAPANAGSFTGSFELLDASGEPLEVADGGSLSVQITAVDLTTPTPVPTSTAGPHASGPVLPPPPPGCKYVKSATYPGEIINLINKARADAGVPTLTLNAQLAASAQAHSTDMACNGYFDHKGRNNSTIHDRVVAAGYAPKFSEEMIFCSGYPADAFKWWMGDPPHHDVIVDPRVKEIGVGYAYLPHSSCGSYYTVDLGLP